MGDAAAGQPLTAVGILDPYLERFASADAVSLEVLPFAQHLNLRLDAASESADAVVAVLGAPLPGPLAWREASEGVSVVWLGPDEWLVVDPARSADLERALRDAVGDTGAVVDQSGQRLSIVVEGDANGLLAKGTAFDLRPAVFGPGAALQGMLAQAVVIFVSRADDPPRVELIVRTSFARYVADWLLDAIADPLAYPAGG